VDGRHVRGVSDYLSAYAQPIGVVVGFARFRAVGSRAGSTVSVGPAYLLDTLRTGWLPVLRRWANG
jgi:hypothetical protein